MEIDKERDDKADALTKVITPSFPSVLLSFLEPIWIGFARKGQKLGRWKLGLDILKRPNIVTNCLNLNLAEQALKGQIL